MKEKCNIIDVICGDTREFLWNFFDWDVFELLRDEFSELIFSQHNWLKIKEKDIFYSHRIKSIIPDLSVYVPKRSKTIFPRPTKLSCYFSGYKGEMMSRDEFLFAFGMDGYDFLMGNHQFTDYQHFTIKEEYFVDKSCTYVSDWGTFPVCTSYHVPVHKLHKEADYYENGLYWASIQVDLFLLLKEGLTPEGLSPECELTYSFLLKLFQGNPNIIGFDEWDDLIFQEESLDSSFLSKIEPWIGEYLLEKANLGLDGERVHGRLPQMTTKKLEM